MFQVKGRFDVSGGQAGDWRMRWVRRWQRWLAGWMCRRRWWQGSCRVRCLAFGGTVCRVSLSESGQVNVGWSVGLGWRRAQDGQGWQGLLLRGCRILVSFFLLTLAPRCPRCQLGRGLRESGRLFLIQFVQKDVLCKVCFPIFFFFLQSFWRDPGSLCSQQVSEPLQERVNLVLHGLYPLGLP